MANFNTITFDGVPIPDFVKVVNIKHSILPPVSQNTLTIGGKAGTYDFGNVIGNREVEIDIKIITPEPNVLPSYLAQLSTWLYYGEAKRLVLGDNVGKYYIAKVSGDTNIKEDLVIGEGTIKFLCTDPYIYGTEKDLAVVMPVDGQPMRVVNEGTAKAFPKMNFTINQDLTSFSVIANNEIIDFGTPFTVDKTVEDLVDYDGYVFNDTLTSLNGWTTPQSIPDGGTIIGNFEVYGNHCFRQTGLDYGEGVGWHGASSLKPLLQETQDFDSTFEFRFHDKAQSGVLGTITILITSLNIVESPTNYGHVKSKALKGQVYNVAAIEGDWYRLSNGYYCSSNPKYSKFTSTADTNSLLGKLQFVILNTNNVPLVTCSIVDSWAASNTAKSIIKVSNGTSSKEVVSKSITSYSDIKGYFNVKRIGNKWTFSLYVSNLGKYVCLYSVDWIDSKNEYMSRISKVQLSTLGYSTYDTPYIELWGVKVITKDTKIEENKIPIILRKDDVLEIDNATGSILKNNIPFYQFLNPSSTFISLEHGDNGLMIYPPYCISAGLISYTERGL